jgi:hypothetical protein
LDIDSVTRVDVPNATALLSRRHLRNRKIAAVIGLRLCTFEALAARNQLNEVLRDRSLYLLFGHLDAMTIQAPN